jgi:hypothetical protein
MAVVVLDEERMVIEARRTVVRRGSTRDPGVFILTF